MFLNIILQKLISFTGICFLNIQNKANLSKIFNFKNYFEQNRLQPYKNVQDMNMKENIS